MSARLASEARDGEGVGFVGAVDGGGIGPTMGVEAESERERGRESEDGDREGKIDGGDADKGWRRLAFGGSCWRWRWQWRRGKVKNEACEEMGKEILLGLGLGLGLGL
ncbi:hypothetical protein Acr_18g0004790 [Actinidia rufa]|uniref:Uncharacterized protein n=1 Tax=Actinidia rufa TaxID=165716 RepID=A0A7J0G6B0_9ERIC|nr:hypothetical protein Acr_18g0004790 [Actinidia rufa]